ncbi:MAG: M16 family metallopeptidase [Phenylobacterium sp.]|uniref:M16 family metallopeptidase n=1 Tax=Phenylobacterium sp. TaxID=1871053 RepID=UPI00391C1017
MIRRLGALAALVAALALSSCASGISLPKLPTIDRAPAAAAALQPGEWPQARSDLAPDPDVRFGALPNGMRYAIRRQTIPPHQAAIRLRFDAGSLMEADDQQGLAHFLEHMAFNGSAAVPEGEMIKILERLGLAFGADTNASTSFDETIYKLDLPRTDEQTVDTALMLMRETAGNLTLDQGAIDRERGVVLSEERTRDTPAYRIYQQRLEFFLKGQLPPKRYPIGQVEVLQTAPAPRFRDFYEKYYRPERAVLVAVGDFDLDAMEAKIKARFGDWSVAAPPGPDPDLGAVARRGAEAKIAIEPGAPVSLQIAWVRPPDRSFDTFAKRRREVVERLGYAVLNRRMQRLARGQEPPFLSAVAFKGDQFAAAEIASVVVNTEPERWREALTAIEQEQRRAVRHGVRQDELDREIAEYRTALQAQAAGAATRTPAALAGEIVNSLVDDRVVTSPAQQLARFEEIVKDLKAQDVSAALSKAFDGEGPLIFMAAPRPIAGGEAALLAAFETSRKVEVTPPAAPSEVAWPYDSFGPPGAVAETREIADLDAVFVRFGNGVRLTVKPTRFKDDEVLVRVNIGRGRIDLPTGRPNLTWAGNAFIEGGLQQISAEDRERVLASRVYGANFGVADDAFVLSGYTRPEDLEVQMQVLAAYASEPAWGAEAFQRQKNARTTLHDQYEATVGGVVARDLSGLLHGGDPRWAAPSREDIAGARLEAFRDDLAPRLTQGEIEVVIVGDTTVEKATAAVAATFGALPPRPQAPPAPPEALQVDLPKPSATPVVRTHKGRPDQAAGYVVWRAADFYADPQLARDNSVLAQVLNLRLIEELREGQGATYAPSAGSNHSLVWPGWGYLAAAVEVPPAKLPEFFADVRKIAADLRTREISEDELGRAKQPRLEQLEKARETNGYWLAELSGAQADPRRLDAIRALIPGVARITPADVRRAAERVLRDDNMWMFEVRPER